MTSNGSAAFDVEPTGPACQAVGVDIIPGVGGFLLGRRFADAERRRGALWTRTLLLGGYVDLFPLPLARPGVMVLSGWASPDVRGAFRDSDAFRELERRSQSLSLDLGAGKARSQHKEFSLNDDGWIARLPAGKSPRGFVAALTYARVTPRGARPFHHYARGAALSARQAEGFLGSVFATQFRAPALRVMTFTVWDQRMFSTQWAFHHEQPHYDALTWMIESPKLMPGGCFGLFPVLAASGTINGVDIAERVKELLRPAKTPG